MGAVGGRECGGFRKSEEQDSYATQILKEEGRTVNPKSKQNQTGAFAPVALAVQFLFVILYFNTDYSFTRETVFGSTTANSMHNGIALMLLVGFGYLRAFLKFYGLGAVGFTFFMVCLGLQWAILLEGSMKEFSLNTKIDIVSFLHASYPVASALIAFGPLLGKISPLQVLVLTLATILFWCANKALFLESDFLSGWVDVGGSISVNVFGAYFGLAASFVLGAAAPWHDADNNVTVKPEVGLASSYFSSVLTLLGTVVVWISMPSFVAAALPMDSAVQRLAVINTFFALFGSTVSVFGCTVLPHSRLHPAPIQSATLAGAIAVGAVASCKLGPGGAILIGSLGGVVSCALYAYPLLPATYDTVNVNALNGVPGLFGGLVSALLPFFMEEAPTSSQTQMIGTCGTLVAAVLAGALTGGLLKLLPRPQPAFHDDTFWDTEHLDGWPDGKDVQATHFSRRRNDM